MQTITSTNSLTQLKQFETKNLEERRWPFISEFASEELWKLLFQKIQREKNKTASLVEQIDEELLKVLDQKVQLKNLDKIRDYLLQFPDVMNVIRKAINAAQKHFPEAQLIMDLYEDPEIEDYYLVLYVRLKNYDDSFVDRLKEAQAEFISDLVNKEGWVQLTTDFRTPGEKSAV
jgi:DNA replicative helicase MCM subunit Mcm2 (Cdc46/Mcm family)